MTTPFDTAVRHGERALDVLRQDIARAAREDQELTHGARALSDGMHRARARQLGDPLLDTSRYLAHARDQHRAIERRRDANATRLGALRDEAGSMVGELQALRRLAEAHKVAVARRASAAEQRAIDDRFAAARSVR